MPIRVYTAKHCIPCHKVEDLVKQGKISEDVELVDVETDEGFEIFKNEVMSKDNGDEPLGVPSAYKDGERCKIGFDEDKNLVFDCPEELPDNTSFNQPEA